ncbi:MAG: Lrp/AsnC family transcriptional regulator [Rhodoferax sp.]
MNTQIDKFGSLDSLDVAILRQLQADATQSNQTLAERVHSSPATCQRRVKRLLTLGVIERQVAVIQPERLAAAIGHGLTAIVEVTLDAQHMQAQDAFAQRVSADAAVQQCYRVSPGPDFVLVVCVRDMPHYHAVAQRLFTQDAQVRNVKAFFSVERVKFGTELPLT